MSLHYVNILLLCFGNYFYDFIYLLLYYVNILLILSVNGYLYQNLLFIIGNITQKAQNPHRYNILQESICEYIIELSFILVYNSALYDKFLITYASSTSICFPNDNVVIKRNKLYSD